MWYHSRSTSSTRRAIRLSALYILFSVAWIVGSDRVLALLVVDSQQLSRLQTVKGAAFVLVTGLLLGLLARRDLVAVERATQQGHDERLEVDERLRLAQARLLQSEKLATLGQLTAGVAHELNNPLTAVIGYTQLLLQTNLPEQVRADLLLIETQAQRAGRIMTNLLAFARQRQTERVPTDLNDVVRRTLDLRAYHLRTNGIALDLRLAPRLPSTAADPFQLQQVVLNIVVNAEQALDNPAWRSRAPAPPRLTIETGYWRDATTAAGSITLRISDTGPGVPVEVQGAIFEPFFTTKSEGEGTGLGLAIARSIIEAHGGSIAVENNTGCGAVVLVQLPVVAAEVQPQATYGLPAPPTSARVLVVDDEQRIREVLARMLERFGAQVDTASDGRAALHLIRRVGYDLLICDLRMPDMSGQALYAALQGQPDVAPPQVLFITGDSVSAEAAAFLAASGCPYLTKPFDVQALLQTVSGMLAPEEHAAEGEQRAIGK